MHPEMDGELIVGIPTVRRYDLLRQAVLCLMYGSRPPDRILVIDNGPGFENPFAWAPVEVVQPPYNLGVAASWNEIHRRAGGDVVILNDDVLVGPRTLENMLAADGPFVTPMPVRDWSCFLQRDALWKRLGPYDEGFWPAFHEDRDYHRRMTLAGIPLRRVESGGLEHRGSGTREGDGFEPIELYVDLVLRRYRHKWGGPDQHEVYERPWDGRPESWDDLEETYRYVTELALELDADVAPHLEQLRRLAAGCRHVTVLGSGRGFAAIALLTARPETMVAVDFERRPAFEQVFRLAELYAGTEVRFERADTLAVDLEPTDLLLIDSTPAYPHTMRELEKHAGAVRRRIVVQNVWRHGRDGSLPRSRGVMTAIEDFLARHDQWRLAAEHPSECGLAVLEPAGAESRAR